MPFSVCHPLPLTSVNNFVPSQITKANGSYMQPAIPHQYRVKAKYPLPQWNLISAKQCKVKFHFFSCTFTTCDAQGLLTV